MMKILHLLLLIPVLAVAQEVEELPMKKVFASDVGDSIELLGPSGVPLGKVFQILGKVQRVDREHHKDTPKYIVIVRELAGKKLRSTMKLTVWTHDGIPEGKWLRMTVFEDALYSRVELPNQVESGAYDDKYLGHRLSTGVVILEAHNP